MVEIKVTLYSTLYKDAQAAEQSSTQPLNLSVSVSKYPTYWTPKCSWRHSHGCQCLCEWPRLLMSRCDKCCKASQGVSRLEKHCRHAGPFTAMVFKMFGLRCPAGKGGLGSTGSFPGGPLDNWEDKPHIKFKKKKLALMVVGWGHFNMISYSL